MPATVSAAHSVPTPPALSCSAADLTSGLRPAGGDTPTASSIRAALKHAGLHARDPRLSAVYAKLDALPANQLLTTEQVLDVVRPNLTLLHRVATRELAIADFPAFSAMLRHVFDQVEPDTSGQNAQYIPVLRDAPSDRFGIAFCSVDGQFHEIGNSRDMFSVQSTSKPITFALALQRLGTKPTLEWCGIEPSGRPFNDMTLLPDNRPFNPMVNSGALMTAAALASGHPHLLARDAEDSHGTRAKELCETVLMPVWSRLAADGLVGDVSFSAETFLSERATTDGNIGIAYSMKARKGLPPSVHPTTMIDFYLRACSITANTAMMSIVAATLANGGTNPITGHHVLDNDVVKKTLSVLSFCGFYDNAGEFFFDTGMPSKSGVSGVVFLVLPNVGGFAFFSPRLDKYGNSVRGGLFAKKLVELFTFHSFDSTSSMANGYKMDPRFSCDFSKQRSIARLQWAVAAGGQHARDFDDLLVALCVRVARMDGSIQEEELDELRAVYRSVMHAELDDQRLKAVISALPQLSGKEAHNELFKVVRAEAKSLDDIEKELLIEAVVKISTADGVVKEQEKKGLAVIAKALHIDPAVMDLHISFWEMKMKEKQEEQ